MAEPIRSEWKTRPGVSEFGAWREHGDHDGFDYYCPRFTPIYAAKDGYVSRKGHHSGGHGHYIAMEYGDAEQSISHMQEASPLDLGDRVTSKTAVGLVGDSGNAKGIVWRGLIHPHEEIRIGGRIVNRVRTGATLVDPRAWHEALNQAGSPGTPITPGDDMPLSDEDIAKIVAAVTPAVVKEVWAGFQIKHPGVDASTNAATQIQNIRRDTAATLSAVQNLSITGPSAGSVVDEMAERLKS